MSSNTLSLSYLCTLCKEPCLESQDCLGCDYCDEWTHLKCTNLSTKQFNYLSKSKSPFYCSSCHRNIICSICSKPCKNGQNCILCNTCDQWKHAKCTSLSIKEFRNFASSDLHFNCDECFKSLFPFNSLDSLTVRNQFQNINNSVIYNKSPNSTSYVESKLFKDQFFKNNQFSL